MTAAAVPSSHGLPHTPPCESLVRRCTLAASVATLALGWGVWASRQLLDIRERQIAITIRLERVEGDIARVLRKLDPGFYGMCNEVRHDASANL